MALRPNRPQSLADPRAPRPDPKAEAQQEVFLREVDDALREDQLLGAARRYGVWIAVALGLALAGLAGWLWYGEHQASQAGKAGETLVVGLDQIEAGRLAEGSVALAPLTAEDAAGPRSASRLMQAGIALEQGRKADAAKLFAEVAGDEDAPRAYRDVAIVRDVAVRFDTLPPDQVVARLKPLAVPGNPWFGSAGELVGAAYLKQGRDDLAGPLFAAMAKDTGVPESLRTRARQLAGVLGVDALGDLPPAAARAPAVGAGTP
ncbi:MAG: tetratricopeptide repeat protein [Novosphingobium sp.]